MTRLVRAEVLLNCGAGTQQAQQLSDEIVRHFEQHGVRAQVQLLHDASELVPAAQQALDARPDGLVAGGGDGTLNAVAGVVARTGVPFGVLPLGTLNHFARDAGIPTELQQAIQTICEGHVVAVDVGRVNGHVFLNNSSVGLYPQIVLKRDQLQQRLRHGKWPAAIWAAFWVLRRFPYFAVTLKVKGEVIRRRTPLVFIGNNGYELDGLRLGKRSCLDAGVLSVHVINSTRRLGLLMLAARALVGRLRQARDFETLYATHVEINTGRRHASVATDGEVEHLAMPLVYDIDKGALSVFVPRATAGKGE
jgi:diacylglycerol kinase family enzyme